LVYQSPSITIDFKTPEEVWSGTLANYTHLRVFRCPAYFHVYDGKLEPWTKKVIFLGYATGVRDIGCGVLILSHLNLLLVGILLLMKITCFN